MIRFPLALAAVAVLLPASLLAQTTAAPQCQSANLSVKAVALPAAKLLSAVVDFSGSGGQLDPTPLLQTDINVVGIPGVRTCVTVTFSTQADPTDNGIVFQASIDNNLMVGHAIVPGFSTPVILEPEETNLNLTRFRSYTFFASVLPGTHTIKVKVASCCTSNPTGVLMFRAATLVARY